MTDAPPLIGLCGYARSGKDAAASALTKHGYSRLSFADNLRSLAYATNPLIHQQHASNPTYLAPLVDAVGWEKAKENPSVRRILQDLGLSCRLTFGEDCWVDALHRQREDGKRHVITDVRFPNEADYIRSRGGILVRIDRPGVGPVNSHPSETAIDHLPADVYLTNDGTLPDLYAKIEMLIPPRA
jgi:hypothetical protein